MRLSIYLNRYLTRETPHAASGSSVRGRSIAARHAHPRTQRGANLIESALAMGLVAIGVFATVSSFGDGTTSRISRGILPVIGGALPSESEISRPDLQSGKLMPIDNVSSPVQLVGSPGGGYNEGGTEGVGGIVGNPDGGDEWQGGDGGVGGIVGNPEDGEEWNGGGDNGSVGGGEMNPPTDDGGTNSSDSGSWSSDDWMRDGSNTWIGGVDAYPETGYQGGNSSGGSNTSAGGEFPTDYYEEDPEEFEFPLENFSSAESFSD